MYWILFIGIALISYWVQSNLQSKFDRYSRMALSNGMTGREIAEKMLRDNGIYDVKVTSTPGMLTDHYNPTNKTVNLSEGVYNTCSVAAGACRCGSRMRTCRTACSGVCTFADAFGTGTGGTVLFFHRTVGLAGRYVHDSFVPAAVAYRYLSFCHDYLV